MQTAVVGEIVDDDQNALQLFDVRVSFLFGYVSLLSFHNFAQSRFVEVVEKKLVFLPLLKMPVGVMSNCLPCCVHMNSRSKNINSFEAILPKVRNSIDCQYTFAALAFATHKNPKWSFWQVCEATLMIFPLARWNWLDNCFFLSLHLL